MRFPSELPVVDLKPGELYVAREPTLIQSILGSCVAVCLYHPRLQAGAMCHAVLPYWYENPTKGPTCFVDGAVDYMMRKVLARGGQPSDLVAKLFGGADVTKVDKTSQMPTIGVQNLAAAKACLQKYDLSVFSEKTGGKKGYKVYFDSSTGKVRLRKVGRPVRCGVTTSER
ncbi:MAG: chemotaxis protein CheD [Desulfobulbaceae bacterium]|nr:chemotaxis protein CheD [Desulfobulbaceae bacterium]